jgi:HPt (histidine-containing phosphotransfer) domain-containing protein
MEDDAVTVTDAGAVSQGGGCDEVWQLPGTLQALAAGGCGTLITELIGMFKTDTDSRLQALDDALVSGNLPLVRQQVHCLKGSASQMGAGKMAAICEQIESTDSETSTRELPGQLKELEAVYERVGRAMDAALLNVPCGGASSRSAWVSSAVLR